MHIYMELNAHYYHACALALLLWLLPSLEKAAGTTLAHWQRDLITHMDGQCYPVLAQYEPILQWHGQSSDACEVG